MAGNAKAYVLTDGIRIRVVKPGIAVKSIGGSGLEVVANSQVQGELASRLPIILEVPSIETFLKGPVGVQGHAILAAVIAGPQQKRGKPVTGVRAGTRRIGSLGHADREMESRLGRIEGVQVQTHAHESNVHGMHSAHLGKVYRVSSGLARRGVQAARTQAGCAIDLDERKGARIAVEE